MKTKISLLRLTLTSGVILFVLTAGLLTVLLLTERSYTRISRQEESFFQVLRTYDIQAQNAVTENDFENLIGVLDRLERRAISVETWLSILKRRRALAELHPASVQSYHNSIQRALDSFPNSPQIIAVAAAALVKNRAITNEAEETLRTWLPFLATPSPDPALNKVRLALHVLLGDFSSPGRASLRAGQLTGIPSGGNENIAINQTILKIKQEDFRGAAANIQTLLHSAHHPSDAVIRLAAEYQYDFGDIERSAELFSMLDDDRALIRQADALFLAGFTGSARTFWSLLADSEEAEVRIRSLYNLALTSQTNDEKIAFLERLVNIDTEAGSDARQARDAHQARQAHQAGIIYFSRLLEHNQAIAMLEGINTDNNPIIDLELCRRRAWLQQPGRQAAEAWLLLDRHMDNEGLYRWAAWKLFSLQNFNETAILLNRLQMLDFDRRWINGYKAIQLMIEGELEAAENILRALAAESNGDAEWHVFANLGQIYETYRSPRRAIIQYELAASKVQNSRAASRIQQRLARCFLALGYFNEALQALQSALDFDPDNLTAQLEIDRIVRQ